MQPEKADYPSKSQTRAGKLSGKVALINDAHTGIGLAVAALFEQEGAEVALSCSDEKESQSTHRALEQQPSKRLVLSGHAADVT
jgi:NAD(P)-dependent dehydrogenase (short-subunit alcohol dehydrogenase family)